MNISLQNVDKVSALLTVNIEKADYQEKVEKVLKTYRQKANIPGFRKGMVPMSLIKKQFGKAVLAEEVDKLMQEKVNEYIHENKVNMLGMPLPNAEKMQPVDFDTQENFEFVFDIALAPEFNAEITNQDTEAVIEESFSIEEKERELILKALEKNHGKRKLAAKDLGISERTLYRKLKEYNLEN